MSRVRLVQLLEGARTWPQRRCNNCKRKRPGAEYQTRTPRGTIVTHPHICFDCVVNAMEHYQ